MLPPDHPLADLQARAALATGWPTLHLDAPAEPALLRALAALEASLGPLPQAELIEAAHPGEPARLRIDLPGLTAASWAAIREVLRDLRLNAALAPADPPGTREAKDQLALVPDTIEPEPKNKPPIANTPTLAPPHSATAAGPDRGHAPPRPLTSPPIDPDPAQTATDAAAVPDGPGPPARAALQATERPAAPPAHIPAILWASPEGDGLWLPDLVEEDPDPPGASLASELVAAVGAIAPELRLAPHRLVAFVRHRPTGRRGIRVAIPASLLDPLPGSALAALRRALVGAVAEVVARRAASTEALAPDLTWDPRFGFALTVWRIGPAGPALPADAPLIAAIEPPTGALAAAIAGQYGRVGAFEVQVLPGPPAAHDAVALAVAEALHGLPLAGGPSRWLAAPAPTFCPTWNFEPSDLGAVLPTLATLADRSDVGRVRVVPVDPIGLEHRAPFVDPAWRFLAGRWFVRWRDGGLDRDALPLARDRDRDSADHRDLAALTSALQRVPGLTAENAPRPVVDGADRPGLAIRLPADTPDWALAWALGAIATAASEDLSTVADLALPPGGPTVLLWRGGTEDRAPLWGYTG